ncbi:S8 family peptidase KNAG_0F02970 [Huiozyma naganishii CBS 8797]|uniref:Peptidase S8/S53 domain-containing protein n=1 Tax=Huiozyma naganishii (strain ATCC MYA-139 / BCRC 22969 / CBS 8797 / KCTC 17520 / NBRC 10181 / NCYC 3082 / Yp74L-3) TaxID=1071383 RepID=J7S7G8_HUIN7|nr:hypothetical protein KNAG_0F02970 [Kazachstania naganishii CBS 8797]CCK70959.1 hypothetical protein KNAG_0F02970 [Kazachstania naganishii CBS 8797]
MIFAGILVLCQYLYAVYGAAVPPLADLSGEHRFFMSGKSTILNEFLVMFKPMVDREEVEVGLSVLAGRFPLAQFEQFHIADELIGFTVKNFPFHNVYFLLQIPFVEMVETNSKVYALNVTVQEDVPWGLMRLSQRDRVRIGDEQVYRYDTRGSAKDVNVYILDTGIQVDHEEFEGRARWGKTIAWNDPDRDDNGHGTHCAGIVGGATYGVAKEANLIAVKVLHATGDGEMSDVIRGIEFAVNEHLTRNQDEVRGSIINLSLGAGESPALQRVVTAALNKGVHFAVAAGNEDDNACYSSPANIDGVVTVGGSTFSDDRAFFSNWGPCIDVFAPGVNVKSSYVGAAKNKTLSLSGTSTSAPHVAGLMAYLLSLEPDTKSQFHTAWSNPAQLKQKLVSLATEGKLFEVPDDTANLMIFNGVKQ